MECGILNLILGDNYENASALVISFPMNNFQQNETFLKLTEAWEQEFINILRNFSESTQDDDNTKIEVSYMAEVTLCTLTFYVTILTQYFHL